MAKKSTPAKSTTPKKVAPKKSPASKAASKKTPAAVRLLSDAEVGGISGEVWNLLHTQGPLTPTAVKKTIDAPGDLVMAAVGWLAREGKLDFQTAGRTVKIALR